MAPILWDSSLETGDVVVDQQHRRIHELFNQLEASYDDASAIFRTLDFLTEHVLVHFSTEEALMDASGYPAPLADRHRTEHRSLIEQVRADVLRFRAGELCSTAPLVEMLRSWITTHIHECDRQLVDFVRARGLHGELPPGRALDAGARFHV